MDRDSQTMTYLELFFTEVIEDNLKLGSRDSMVLQIINSKEVPKRRWVELEVTVMKMTSHRAVDDVFGTINFFDFAFCGFSVAIVALELEAGATNEGFGTVRLELDRRDKM
jgi:hypothetical protein